MNITNLFGVPDEYVALAEIDDYDNEGADFSITTLIDAPQVYKLRTLHPESHESDVCDLLAAMIGSAIHNVFEGAAAKIKDRVVEKRFTIEIQDKSVSGKIDKLIIHDDGSVSIRDMKVIKAASFGFAESKVSWLNQLNAYAAMLRVLGYRVRDLAVEAIVKDWTRSKVKYSESYPKSPVEIVPIEMWDADVAHAYLEDRVRLHSMANPPPCTPVEYWGKSPVYAFHEYLGNTRDLKKRATKLFDSMIDASHFAEGRRGELLERPGGRTRCETNYCGVAAVCQQYKDAVGDTFP